MQSLVLFAQRESDYVQGVGFNTCLIAYMSIGRLKVIWCVLITVEAGH